MNATPFEMFCLYYLGLTPEGERGFFNANKIAKRLNWTPQDVLDYLKNHGMHPDSVLNSTFPMARYQADLQIAAENDDAETLRARAEMIYETFNNQSGQGKRNWLQEIEQERENDREAEMERRRRERFSS